MPIIIGKATKVKMSQNHSLNILEYDKIIQQLAGHAMTQAGRKLCLELLPSTELAEVESRLAETDDFLSYVLAESVLPLSGLEEIRPILTHAENEAVLDLRDLNKVIHFLQVVAAVKKQVEESEHNHAFYDRVNYLEDLPNLLKRLRECVAGDDEMYDRASDDLFRIRRAIKNSQEQIKNQLNRIISSHGQALQEGIVTIRNDRYVLPVKSECCPQIPGLVHDTSGSGATLFIEPLAVVELNNRIKEEEAKETAEVYRILRDLSARVAEIAAYLRYDAEVLAELDLSQAKALLSLKMRGTSPKLNAEGRIILREARHPLIPDKQVVPIYFELGTSFNTLVITGPNTGGKTVTLKTCGLLTLMAMAGLHIPAAENSEVSVFSQILADIGDEQSIEQNLSTFSSHLKQIIQILDQAGPRSLVLTDELGAGTDPSEGAALAISILDALRNKGCHTVATTHYRELKGYALNTDGVNNACCEFDEENLQPSYRLLIGVPGVSNAFKISEKLGLPRTIIEAAKELVSDENTRFEELVAAIEKSHQEARRLEDELKVLAREEQVQKEQLGKEKAKLQQEKQRLISTAQQEAQSVITRAQAEVEEMLEDIRQNIKKAQLGSDWQDLQKQAKNAERILAEKNHKLSHQIRQGQKKHREGKALKPDQINIGKSYYSNLYGLTGQVVEILSNKEAILKSGVMTVNVPLSSLEPVELKTGKEQTKHQNKKITGDGMRQIVSRKTGSFRPEIKLLGLTVAEALTALDDYLDDAVLSNAASVRIVHGKGTGALRQAVQDFLKMDRRVKEYRLAGPGEGESGVTIAEL